MDIKETDVRDIYQCAVGAGQIMQYFANSGYRCSPLEGIGLSKMLEGLIETAKEVISPYANPEGLPEPQVFYKVNRSDQDSDE